MSTITEMTIIVLTESAFHLVALARVVTATPNIIKGIAQTYNINVSSVVSVLKTPFKLISVLSTFTVSIIRSQLKNIIVSVAGTISMVKALTLSKILSFVSTSSASIVISIGKIMTVLSTTISTLNKQMSRVLSVISATISSLLAVLFPRLGSVVRFTFVADLKDRTNKLFKVRNVLANKKKTNTQR